MHIACCFGLRCKAPHLARYTFIPTKKYIETVRKLKSPATFSTHLPTYVRTLMCNIDFLFLIYVRLCKLGLIFTCSFGLHMFEAFRQVPLLLLYLSEFVFLCGEICRSSAEYQVVVGLRHHGSKPNTSGASSTGGEFQLCGSSNPSPSNQDHNLSPNLSHDSICLSSSLYHDLDPTQNGEI